MTVNSNAVRFRADIRVIRRLFDTQDAITHHLQQLRDTLVPDLVAWEEFVTQLWQLRDTQRVAEFPPKPHPVTRWALVGYTDTHLVFEGDDGRGGTAESQVPIAFLDPATRDATKAGLAARYGAL